MIIYISGRITGDNNYKRKFHEAERRLAFAGYTVVNPARSEFEASWNEGMRRVLRSMLGCHGVALLTDWNESKGAQIEERLAREVGIPVKPLEKWLEEKELENG